MTLVLSCGNDYGLLELLKRALAQHTSLAGPVDQLMWKVIRKTKADLPPECGRELTFAEKLKSAISITDCNGTNVVAINYVSESCECLRCGIDNIPCNESELPFEHLAKQAFCYTTDGEWAFYLGDITAVD